MTSVRIVPLPATKTGIVLKNIVIAIDGFSACGKSTLAKALAHRLGYGYVDTGAMYRAVTLYFIRHSIDDTDEKAVADALDNIQITFTADPERGNRTRLNGEDVRGRNSSADRGPFCA